MEIQNTCKSTLHFLGYKNLPRGIKYTAGEQKCVAGGHKIHAAENTKFMHGPLFGGAPLKKFAAIDRKAPPQWSS
jgi:hypothetical protein